MQRWIYEFVTDFYVAAETVNVSTRLVSIGDRFKWLNKQSALDDLQTDTEF